ncbi:DUF4376 domain-containing protein [Burkholderia contaminans]|uniref:DUF4376 domain-containing protein n=1 Tax=Burkholderia contaminans TaxID=488447 RepID=UPI000F55A33D|nr:hypothetical protein [Burkholderia contaminans]
MIFTITFDATGNPEGFSQYSDAESMPDPLPEGEVLCTAEQCANWQSYVLNENQIVAAPDATLVAVARVVQIAKLKSACASAIVSGFSSTALGTSHSYPSALTDQANQQTVAQAEGGGLLWCEAGGTWAFSNHTQAQAQQVVSDFAKWLNACQSKLSTLSNNIAQATTVAAVKGAAWTNP